MKKAIPFVDTERQSNLLASIQLDGQQTVGPRNRIPDPSQDSLFLLDDRVLVRFYSELPPARTPRLDCTSKREMIGRGGGALYRADMICSVKSATVSLKNI
jgi:hypothetical protein